jgi:predicted nucleic acid-binding protein
MRVCLDASAVVDWILPQGAYGVRPLDRFLKAAEEVLAPPLVFAESTSVIRRLAHSGVLTDAEAERSVLDAFNMQIVVVHNPDIYLRALRVATVLGHAKAYDTQYIAVAEATGATLLTSDGGMHANATRLGIPCELLK